MPLLSQAQLSTLCGARAQMWQWKRSEGKEFVFFQSHAAMSFGSQNVTNEFYQKIICHLMANSLHLVVERTQRWKCPTYREGGRLHSPACQLTPCLQKYVIMLCISMSDLYM